MFKFQSQIFLEINSIHNISIESEILWNWEINLNDLFDSKYQNIRIFLIYLLSLQPSLTENLRFRRKSCFKLQVFEKYFKSIPKVFQFKISNIFLDGMTFDIYIPEYLYPETFRNWRSCGFFYPARSSKLKTRILPIFAGVFNIFAEDSRDLATPRTGEHDRMLNSSQEENTESRGRLFQALVTWCTFDARSPERSTPRRDQLEPRRPLDPSSGDCCRRRASSRPVPSLRPRSALSFRCLWKTENRLIELQISYVSG